MTVGARDSGPVGSGGARSRWRCARAVGLSLLLGSFALAGCAAGGSADPGPTVGTYTPPPSPTPTMGPAVAEPEKPEAWADSGPDGAAAAAVWFLSDEYRYVLETNDTTEWQRLSHPECVFCASVTATTAQAAERGVTSREGAGTVVRVTRVEELNPLAYSVLVRVDATGIRDFDSAGNLVDESDASSGQMLLTFLRTGHDWQFRAGEWFELDAEVPSAFEGD